MYRVASPSSPFDIMPQAIAHHYPAGPQAAAGYHTPLYRTTSVSPGRPSQLSVQIPDEMMTDATTIEGGGGLLRLSPAPPSEAPMAWPCAPTGHSIHQPQFMLQACPWQQS